MAFFTTVFKRSLYKCLFLRNFNQVNLEFIHISTNSILRNSSFPSAFSLFCGNLWYIVEPYFRFCCPVWGSCSVTAVSKLKKLQNRAARIVTDSSYKTSAFPILEKLGWLTVNDLIETETLKMVFKSKNQLALENLNSIFVKVFEFRNRQLRASDTDLYVPLLKTTCGQKYYLFCKQSSLKIKYTKI